MGRCKKHHEVPDWEQTRSITAQLRDVHDMLDENDPREAGLKVNLARGIAQLRAERFFADQVEHVLNGGGNGFKTPGRDLVVYQEPPVREVE